MERQRVFKIPNLCCETCAALIRQSVVNLPGVSSIEIAIPTRRMTVQWHAPTTWQDIERQLDMSGYPPGPPLG